MTATFNTNWREQFTAMEVGETMSCPLMYFESIKNAVSVLKMKGVGVWKTKTKREDGVILVTRLS